MYMGQKRVVQKFEDLIAWQKARALTKQIYDLTATPTMARHRRFCEQFESAALSIMNNISEGYERNGRADFARFLTIAKGSCGEVRSMAYVATDSGFISAEVLVEILAKTDQLSRIIHGLRTTVDRQRASERPKAPKRTVSSIAQKLEARS